MNGSMDSILIPLASVRIQHSPISCYGRGLTHKLHQILYMPLFWQYGR